MEMEITNKMPQWLLNVTLKNIKNYIKAVCLTEKILLQKKTKLRKETGRQLGIREMFTKG